MEKYKVNICHVISGSIFFEGDEYEYAGGANTRVFLKRISDGKEIQVSAYSDVEIDKQQAVSTKRYLEDVLRSTLCSIEEYKKGISKLEEQGI